MRQQSFFITLGLAAVTSLATISLPANFSQSTAAESQSNQVTFLCQSMFDPASGERIPTTVAWIPERKGHVYFIGWKSEYFNQGGWTPAERCQKVSQKFQEFYEQGRLNFLATGKIKGYSVICGVLNQGETCNPSNQLFTLKTGSDAEDVIQKLMDIADGKSAGIIFQNSGEQLYVSVKDFLKKSPLTNNN